MFPVVECEQATTSIAVLCILDAPEAMTLEMVGRNEEIETETGKKSVPKSLW